MDNLVIVGTGVNAGRALEFIQRYKLFNVIGFAVNKEYLSDSEFNGLPVFALENLEDVIKCHFKVFIAVYWNRLNRDRRNLFDYCSNKGYKFANLISPLSNIFPSVKLGRNCWIFDFVTIHSQCEIEDNTFLLPYTFLGANVKIGKHCFFSARTLIGGGSTIGEQCFFGFNAVVLDVTEIGQKCIIGATSLVRRNLPDFCRYTAEPITKISQYKEDEIENKLLFSKNVR